jgi:hypothetical protein
LIAVKLLEIQKDLRSKAEEALPIFIRMVSIQRQVAGLVLVTTVPPHR